MIDAPLAYAFTLGLVAVVNPCGFPMLPAYVSYFIGRDDDAERDLGQQVLRALRAGAAVSMGFLAVFAGLGVPVNAGITSIYRFMPWLTIVVGAGLVVLGVATLFGFRLKVALPRLDRGGGDRSFRSMVLFGVSYAVASLGCTLPLFLALVGGTIRRSNAVSGVLTFAAYGLGMSAVLMVLTLALALAQGSIVGRLRDLVRFVDAASGVLLVLVGSYLVYYWAYNLSRNRDDAIGSSPIGAVEEWSASFSAWLAEGGVALGLVFGVAVAAAAVTAWTFGRRRPTP